MWCTKVAGSAVRILLQCIIGQGYDKLLIFSGMDSEIASTQFSGTLSDMCTT